MKKNNKKRNSNQEESSLRMRLDPCFRFWEQLFYRVPRCWQKTMKCLLDVKVVVIRLVLDVSTLALVHARMHVLDVSTHVTILVRTHAKH